MSRFLLQALFMTVLTPFAFRTRKPPLFGNLHKIIKLLPYLLMTDTDSGLLEFIVIAEDTCDCGGRQVNDILLRMFLDNDIQHRLDLSG